MKMNDKEKIYNCLKQYEAEYRMAKNGKERDRIENNVRRFAKGIDDEIYLGLNNNSAGGLFDSRFFESDLDNALSLLRNR